MKYPIAFEIYKYPMNMSNNESIFVMHCLYVEYGENPRVILTSCTDWIQVGGQKWPVDERILAKEFGVDIGWHELHAIRKN